MYIRGPTVMKAYHKNPKATEESMTKDGFFKTGDLGYFQPGVGLFITDRIKELIKVRDRLWYIVFLGESFCANYFAIIATTSTILNHRCYITTNVNK